jgi:hypothetical protein
LHDKEVVIDSCTGDADKTAAVIIGSEPLTYDEKCWKLIPRNSIVSVSETNEVTIEDLQVEVCPVARRAFKVWKKRAIESDVVGQPLLQSANDIASPPDPKRPKLEETNPAISAQAHKLDFSQTSQSSN